MNNNVCHTTIDKKAGVEWITQLIHLDDALTFSKWLLVYFIFVFDVMMYPPYRQRRWKKH